MIFRTQRCVLMRFRFPSAYRHLNQDRTLLFLSSVPFSFPFLLLSLALIPSQWDRLEPLHTGLLSLSSNVALIDVHPLGEGCEREQPLALALAFEWCLTTDHWEFVLYGKAHPDFYTDKKAADHTNIQPPLGTLLKQAANKISALNRCVAMVKVHYNADQTITSQPKENSWEN